MDKYIPFPQADDIEKIFAIVNVSKSEYLSDYKKMSTILENISERQVSYYLSAAIYLGIIEIKNRKKVLTKYGMYLRTLNSSLQCAELIVTILSDPVFRKTYIFQKLYGERNVEDVVPLIKEYHPECTDKVCLRRSQTVISWVRWIIEKLDN